MLKERIERYCRRMSVHISSNWRKYGRNIIEKKHEK